MYVLSVNSGVVCSRVCFRVLCLCVSCVCVLCFEMHGVSLSGLLLLFVFWGGSCCVC